MKKLIVLLFLSRSIISYSQIDSSNLYTIIITEGKSKSWYTRPVIIDNPRQIQFSTLTFKFDPKSGNFNRSGRGRSRIESRRNFNNCKIEKQDEKYVLIISPEEKYFITLTGLNERVLFIRSFHSNRARLNITGHFFETPLKIN